MRGHSHLLALTLAVAGNASCGRINYDAQSTSVDASPDLSDGSTACGAPVTGSYVGDGSIDRRIAVGAQPALVIVQSEAGNEAVMRTTTMPAGLSKPAVGAQGLAPRMLADAVDGFAVGADPRVNAAGVSYQWLALPASSDVAVGQYVGNGATQSITGVGFQPDWLLVADEDDGIVVVRFANPAALTYRLEGLTGVPDGVTSFDADGFALGGRPFSNRDARTFHYVAWRAAAGRVAVGEYTGDGADNRRIAGLGLRPSYLIIRGEDDAAAVHRFESLAGDASLAFGAQAPMPDAIQALDDDAFELGASAATNTIGTSYDFTAFASCSP